MIEPSPDGDAAPTNPPAGQAVAGTWTLAPKESRMEFAVKHFWGLVTVHGHFEAFQGEAVVDESGGISASLAVNANSVQTNNARRDKHLRSADFFDVDRNPTLTFVTRQVTRVADGGAQVAGELTIAGHTEDVEFDTTIAVASADEASADATLSVDRTRFGMTWSPLGMSAATAHLTLHLRFTRAAAG